MFQEKTVFILGAGASWHYGLPTGAKLVREIEKFCSEPESYIFLNEAFPSFENVHEMASEAKKEDFSNFQKLTPLMPSFGELDNLRRRIKTLNPLVIDNFLDENADIAEVGKFAIAAIIMYYEALYINNTTNFNRENTEDCTKIEIAAENLYPESYPKSIYFKKQYIFKQKQLHFLDKDDWYRFLISHLVKDSQPFSNNDEEKAKRFFQKRICNQFGMPENSGKIYNDVYFVTFNYDTTLDYSLHNALNEVGFLNGKSEEIKAFVQSRIDHVYGSTRDNFLTPTMPADFELESFQRYIQQISEASKRIKTINSMKDEDIKTRERLDKIQNIITDADKIYILGYGFDSVNNNRIGLDKIFSLQGPRNLERKICYTNHDNKNSVNKVIREMILHGVSPEMFTDITEKLFQDTSSPIIRKDANWPKITFEKSTRDVYGALASDFVF